MAALIEYVCTAKHERRGDPAVTIEQKSWAYCATGANGAHEWLRIEATPLETLRSRPGNGRPYFVPDESDERSLTSGPGG